jgi:sn-glycerol 3-phosphate transport system substrate-binding protein
MVKSAFRLLQLAVAVAVVNLVSPAKAATDILWWHAMSGELGRQLEKLAADFNASQSDYRIVPGYKGNYTETVTAAIFAFRSRSQPAIVQVNEIGTATMMAARGAIYPVFELMRDEQEPFSPAAYLPAVTGYYSDVAGNMLSFPFNASTPILYYNKDLFRGAGLDPEIAPKTWAEVGAAAVLDQCREFFRLPQSADRDKGQRLRRPRCRAQLQQSGRGAPHSAIGRMAEHESVRL